LFSMKQVYRYLTDKPTGGIGKDVAALVSYSTNPGESAYYTARQIVSDFSERQGDETATIIPTKKQNALYYHKQALRYGDKELAERWKKRYMDMGGTERGMAMSIEKSHPLASLSNKKRKQFEAELTTDEQAIIAKAVQWYEKVYK
jgi:hypothetical protein